MKALESVKNHTSHTRVPPSPREPFRVSEAEYWQAYYEHPECQYEWNKGHPNVRWRRNLTVNPKACLTLDNTTSPVIVEGVVVVTGLAAELASRVADASNAKYKFNQTAADFREDVCVLTPKTVLVWTGVFENATRFSFPS